MALAHRIPNAVGAAYRSGVLSEKRRQLMNDCAAYRYCQQSEVIQLVRGSTARMITILFSQHCCGSSTSLAIRTHPPIVPLSRSAWWQGAKDGKYPSPIKIGANTTLWSSDDIQKLVDDMCASKIS